MSMISVKTLLAFFVFISSLSCYSDATAIAIENATYWNEYCVADVQTSEHDLIAGIDWACKEVNCRLIDPNQTCYFQNNTFKRANYAFNLYYQQMKHRNGTCYFKAAALVSAVAPEYPGETPKECKLSLSA